MDEIEEKLQYAERLNILVEKVYLYDKEAAAFMAKYVLAYIYDTLDTLPMIHFNCWAKNIDDFCTWSCTPQGHLYWSDLNKKVGNI